MVAKRPSIYIYVNKPSEKILKEVCAGIEEEGIFFEVMEKEIQETDTLTMEAAKDAMLGSGIGICGNKVGFQVKELAKGAFISYYEAPSCMESRILGMNSARAVKKLPFREME